MGIANMVIICIRIVCTILNNIIVSKHGASHLKLNIFVSLNQMQLLMLIPLTQLKHHQSLVRFYRTHRYLLFPLSLMNELIMGETGMNDNTYIYVIGIKFDSAFNNILTFIIMISFLILISLFLIIIQHLSDSRSETIKSINRFVIQKCLVSTIMLSYVYLCVISIFDLELHDATKTVLMMLLILAVIIAFVISIAKFDDKDKFPYTLAYYSNLTDSRQARFYICLGLLRKLMFVLITSNIYKARSEHRVHMILSDI